MAIRCCSKVSKHYQTPETAIQQEWASGLSLRITNVYGPGPKSSSGDRGVLNAAIKKALQGEELLIYGSGEYLRDYIYIDDVIFCFLSAPMHIKKMNGRHFVLGSGVGATVKDAILLVGRLVHEVTGMSVPIRYMEPPNAFSRIEFREFVANTTALRNLFGPETSCSLDDGIKKAIDYIIRGE